MDTDRRVTVLRRYDGGSWVEVTGICTKIAATGLGRGFQAGDGVTVSGCGALELNGLHVLKAAADDWVLIPAMCRALDSQTAAVTVMRTIRRWTSWWSRETGCGGASTASWTGRR